MNKFIGRFKDKNNDQMYITQRFTGYRLNGDSIHDGLFDVEFYDDSPSIVVDAIPKNWIKVCGDGEIND